MGDTPTFLEALRAWLDSHKRELSWWDEAYRRDDLAYRLARRGMTSEMAKGFAAKVPRAWL